MNKRERKAKKDRAREQRCLRKWERLFLGHHTRPSYKYKDKEIWELNVRFRRMMKWYGISSLYELDRCDFEALSWPMSNFVGPTELIKID